VPENAGFAIAVWLHRRQNRFQRFENAKILMVLGHDLDWLVVFVLDEKQIVLDNVQETGLIEKTIDENVQRMNAVAVVPFFSGDALPFDETIFGAGQGPYLSRDAIGNNQKGVEVKQRRNIVTVPILLASTAELREGMVKSRVGAGFVKRLQFHHD